MNTDIALLNATLLTMVRLGFLILRSPLKALRAMPITARFILLLMLAYWLCITLHLSVNTQSPNDFGLMIVIEGLNGIILNSFLTFALGAIQTSGQFIDTQMGLNALSFFNPQALTHDSFTSTLFTLLAGLLFFQSGGVGLMLTGFLNQLQHLSLGTLFPITELTTVIHFFGETLTIAIALACPIVLLMLLLDITQAILMRSMPHVNAYFMALPLKLLAGFMIFIPLLSHITRPITTLLQLAIKHY